MGNFRHDRRGADESFPVFDVFREFVVVSAVERRNPVVGIFRAAGVVNEAVEHPFEIAGIKIDPAQRLAQIVQAGRLFRRRPRLIQRRQQHRSENRDDRYYIDLKKLIS